MNDHVSGQLVLDWAIPKYAQAMLWLDSDSGCVPIAGVSGLFTLPAPAERLTLRWGGASGPALARLPWRADCLEWDGGIRFGGMIDAKHVIPSDDAFGALAILTVVGYPLTAEAFPPRVGAKPPPVPFAPLDYFRGLDAAGDLDDHATTWLTHEDSPLMALAQDALVSRLHVWCFGRLAADEARWHERAGLPIWLSEMILFSV